jgi:MerR family transcriptional regulator, repressor of the yfmOP operon
LEKTAFHIDEIAIRTGLTKRALRYYEDLGLIAPLRTESGYRLYLETDIEKITHIKEIRESLGFSLNDIKEFLQLEQNLQKIFNDHSTDLHLVEKSLEMMKTQIDQIEIKEQSLAKVMAKYKNKFAELNHYYLTLQEGTTYKHEKKD